MGRVLSRIAIPAVIAAVTLFIPSASQADPYKYCAVQGGNGGSTNCGFRTYEQCMQQVRGMGGWCQPNAYYTGPDKDEEPPKRKRK
jgi:uncharacterized protein DUF3551